MNYEHGKEYLITSGKHKFTGSYIESVRKITQRGSKVPNEDMHRFRINLGHSERNMAIFDSDLKNGYYKVEEK